MNPYNCHVCKDTKLIENQDTLELRACPSCLLPKTNYKLVIAPIAQVKEAVEMINQEMAEGAVPLGAPFVHQGDFIQALLSNK